VVVTGLGAVSPLGLSVSAFWQGLVSGRSGIRRVTQFDASDLPCQIAGEVPDFDPSAWMEVKEARRMSRASQFAVAATRQALSDAELDLARIDPDMTGVTMGTGFGGLDRVDVGLSTYRTKGFNRIGPFALISALPNMPAHHAGLLVGARGPTATVVTACASGTQAIGEAADTIRRGLSDVMLAGGVEGLIHVLTLAGFAAMRGLSTRHNDDPPRALRPFDRDRDGFIVSEGCAVLVLEELGHALRRGARIYAEVLGHAASADAHHVAAPDPTADGAVRAMRWALRDARVSPQQIDYINPHGSSTPIGDATETLAIKKLFGESAYSVPISSTKSMIGHALGAAGALEAVACVKTIETGTIHPTINYTTPDPECDLDYVPNQARAASVRTVLSNSFGLGGQNACLVLARYEPDGAGGEG
jgi:beta-ketoacyl-acyl-carrier-protein synthase II